jgi:hypothetical protein
MERWRDAERAIRWSQTGTRTIFRGQAMLLIVPWLLCRLPALPRRPGPARPG